MYWRWVESGKGGMYSLTMARAHPYRGFFWQSVLISVVALAHHHSHFAPAGIRSMVCLHGTIPRTVSLSLYQCALPTTLAGLISTLRQCFSRVAMEGLCLICCGGCCGGRQQQL